MKTRVGKFAQSIVCCSWKNNGEDRKMTSRMFCCQRIDDKNAKDSSEVTQESAPKVEPEAEDGPNLDIEAGKTDINANVCPQPNSGSPITETQ